MLQNIFRWVVTTNYSFVWIWTCRLILSFTIYSSTRKSWHHGEFISTCFFGYDVKHAQPFWEPKSLPEKTHPSMIAKGFKRGLMVRQTCYLFCKLWSGLKQRIVKTIPNDQTRWLKHVPQNSDQNRSCCWCFVGSCLYGFITTRWRAGWLSSWKLFSWKRRDVNNIDVI